MVASGKQLVAHTSGCCSSANAAHVCCCAFVPADVAIKNAIMGDGSMVKSGAKITNSIIGLRSLIGENCDIQDTLMLGSDYYETLDECAFVPGCLPMGIGAGSVVRKALIDKNARIGENVKILNKEGVVENLSTESKGYVIRDGIVVSAQCCSALTQHGCHTGHPWLKLCFASMCCTFLIGYQLPTELLSAHVAIAAAATATALAKATATAMPTLNCKLTTGVACIVFNGWCMLLNCCRW